MRVLGVLCVLAMVGAQAWWCPGCLPGQLAESEDCSETEESRPEASHERHTARDLIRVAHHQEDPRDSARPIAGTVALDRLTGPVAAPAACPLFMRHCRLLM